MQELLSQPFISIVIFVVVVPIPKAHFILKSKKICREIKIGNTETASDDLTIDMIKCDNGLFH